MKDCLLVAEPALLMKNEIPGHAARNDRPRAALREIGFERDGADRTLQVERGRFSTRERVHGDLS